MRRFAARWMPLAMVLVARIGLASGAAFRRHRRVTIVVAAVLSAVLTPSADPLSMLLMFFPPVGRYQAGIGAIWFADRHAARRAKSADRELSDDLFASWLIPLVASQLVCPRRKQSTVRA